MPKSEEKKKKKANKLSPAGAEILKQYECGPMVLFGDENSSFERRLILDHVTGPRRATVRERFEALAGSVRDLLTQRWLKTQRAHERGNPKQVYYLSMEFLIGRSLANNLTNLRVEPLVGEAMEREGLELAQLLEAEVDAGLGNGGLGRLAACFIDSLATLEIPAIGYGLRYEYGIFRQEIEAGYQVERPDNWLRDPDPWEVMRRGEAVEVIIEESIEMRGGQLTAVPDGRTVLRGIPYDRPVIGYGGRTINTLRLWGAAAPESFNFQRFSSGDLIGAELDQLAAEAISRVLYPNDTNLLGHALRFIQEHFLVACSLADIVARFRHRGNDWSALPDKVAIQLNDTHPAIAVAELMRILLDEARLGWDEAWDLTRRSLAYTNHTLLPEALEKWQVRLFDRLLPRQLEIIYEINRRFLNEVSVSFPGDLARLQRMSLIEEGSERKVRMANLAIVGTHSTNGVSAIHSALLRTRVVKDFAEMFPERFNNKTNGVTPRRWLRLCNPGLAQLITESIGDGWVTDLSGLRRLVPLAEDAGFRDSFRQAKRAAKARFADWVRAATGQVIDLDSIFDSQAKRIHEYKRQLLNLLHIVVLYNRLRDDPGLGVPSRTFFFAGKAAPGYALAKLIIKLINNVAAVVNADPAIKGRLKVLFLPDYSVTLAERLIPASDVSEQISTAGYEASGTGNMKFMMNGALTVGTRDGATIEMAEEAGEENLFLFGLTADEVQQSRGVYDPRWHYENEPETRRALDLIFNDYFSSAEPGIFNPLREMLLARGDFYMHLADLTSYARAQAAVGALYGDPEAWTRKAVINVGSSGKFSSDRTITEYATEIWGAKPCPVG